MEEKGLSAPTSLLEMLRESSLLNDAIHSACCGRPVAWQSFWRHERRGRNKNGRADFGEIFDAHLKFAKKVVLSSFVSLGFAEYQCTDHRKCLSYYLVTRSAACNYLHCTSM